MAGKGKYPNVTSDNAAAKALAEKWGGKPNGESGFRWNYAQVDGRTMLELVGLVAARGGAVMFGVDRQLVGGTLCVWYNGEKIVNRWYRPDESGYAAFQSDMDGLIVDFANL